MVKLRVISAQAQSKLETYECYRSKVIMIKWLSMLHVLRVPVIAVVKVTIYDYLYQGPEFPNLDVLADDKFV